MTIIRAITIAKQARYEILRLAGEMRCASKDLKPLADLCKAVNDWVDRNIGPIL